MLKIEFKIEKKKENKNWENQIWQILPSLLGTEPERWLLHEINFKLDFYSSVDDIVHFPTHQDKASPTPYLA